MKKSTIIQKKIPPEQVKTRLTVFDFILLAAFFTFIAITTTFKFFQDDDVFWHLATGRFIFQNGYIPSTDVFGFLTNGFPWVPLEWGWDSFTYLLFNIGGFYALSIFRTLIIMTLFSLIILFLQKNKISYSLIIPFSILLLFGLLSRFNLRPQIATYLFLIVIILIFYNFKSSSQAKKNIIFILPVLFLIWVNLHMGVLLGLLIFGLFAASEEIDYILHHKNKITEADKKKKKYLRYSLLFSILAILINPHFINTFVYTFNHTQMDLLNQINEWKSPFSTIGISYYYVKIYLFFLISGIFIIYYSFKEKFLFPALLFIVIGIYSVQAIRFISDFMLIIFIAWVISLNYLLGKINVNKFIDRAAAKIIITIFLGFLIINASNNVLYTKYLGNNFRETGFGLNEKFFPKTMFDFIEKEKINRIGEKPFNNLNIGGYFIWSFPGSKNFIDSRNLNDSIFTIYKNIDLKKYGFETRLEYYGIDYVIYNVPTLTLHATEIEKNIISYLSTSNNKWKLVYWDDGSFLFVRNLPKFQDVISRYEYKYISPYRFIFDRKYFDSSYLNNEEEFTAELKKKLKEDTKGIIINDMAEYLKTIH